MIRPRTVIAILFSLAAVVAIIAIFLWPRNVIREPVSREEADAAYVLLRETLINGQYTYDDFLTDNSNYLNTVSREEITAQVSQSPEPVSLEGFGEIIVTAQAPETGFYSVSANAVIEGNAFDGATVEVLINGKTQYYEASIINIPTFWRDTTKVFPTDRFGDETKPEQIIIRDSRRVDFYDNKFASSTPLLFLLNEGENTLTIRNNTSRRINISEIEMRSGKSAASSLLSYDEYITKFGTANTVTADFISVNAIDYTYKNSPYVQLGSEGNAAMTPFDAINKKINITLIEKAGSEAFYTADVPEDGLYAFSFHALPKGSDYASFVTLKVDGQIPFAEAAAFSLMPKGVGEWSNYTLKGADGEPYYIHLSKGAHEFSLPKPRQSTVKPARFNYYPITSINFPWKSQASQARKWMNYAHGA